MKKVLLILTALILTSCGNAKKEEKAYGLKGKFSNSIELKVLHRKDISTESRYVYTSSFPLNTISGYGCYESTDHGEGFCYNYNQALSLFKDGTYHYVYDISFGNPTKVSNLMGIDVDVYGTYTYHKMNDDEYIISISNPLGGTESYYGCNFSVNELFWFGGGISSRHSSPDKVNDFELNREQNIEEYDWYVRNRTVRITFNREKLSDSLVFDDLFNSYFLDDVGQFCTY